MQLNFTKRIEPFVSLIIERLSFDEIKLKDTESFKPEFAAQSIDLLFRDLQPNIVILDNNGIWEIVGGSLFVQGIIEYVNDRHVYPASGALSRLHNKRFSELDRSTQRAIKMFKLHATIKNTEIREEDNVAFDQLLEIAKSFS